MPATLAPELAGFLAKLKDEPGDATTVLVAADWLEENPDAMPDSAYKIEDLRRVGAVLRTAWNEWVAFGERLTEIADGMSFYGDAHFIPVKTRDRHCPQREQAALARDLFKELKLKGVSVTCATGSMCFWVDVKLPGRIDNRYLMALDPTWDMMGDKGFQAQRWARTVIERILLAAFPNHDDRSRMLEDYYDDPWRIEFKTVADYEPKRRRKPLRK